MADGRLWFNTKIDNKGIEKDLRELEGKIKKSQQKIADAEGAKLPLENQLKSINEELELGKQKLESYKKRLTGLSAVAWNPKTPEDREKAKAEIPTYISKVEAQEEEVKRLQKAWDEANDKLKSYGDEIEKANNDIQRHQAKAAELSKTLKSPAAKLQAAYDKAHQSSEKFGKRLLEIGKSALIFNVVSSLLRGVVNYMGKVLKSNTEYTAQLAKLKGALLTAFQPIYEFVLPGVVAVLRVLTAVASVIANVISGLFGKTAKESAQSAKALNAQAEAVEGVGNAAEKAKKSLAGFDEINTLSSGKDESASGGAGGGGGTGVQADFSDFNTDEYKAKIDELTVYLSGALLALGAILAFSGANIPLGIGLMVAGAAGLASVIAPNWNTMSDELKGAISLVLGVVGGAFLVIGAILAFSGASIVKGIALMALGAAALGTAVALNWNSIKNALQGPIGAVAALVSGALLAIGLILAFTGANLPLGIAMIAAGAAGLVTVTALNWNAIINSLRGPVGAVVALASGALLAIGLILAFTGANLPLGIAMIAAGAAGLVTVTALNWNAIKDKLASVWKSVQNWYNTSVAPKLTLTYWKTKFANIATGLSQKIKDGINAAITLFNKFISWINSKMSFSWSDKYLLGQKIVSAGSIQLFTIPQIPMLAQGAVIPPNAPFMAMLGDQKHGTNIEAPLSTIQDAVAAVMQDYAAANLAGHEATVAVLREILEAVLGIEVGDEVIANAVKRYNSRMAVVRGG